MGVFHIGLDDIDTPEGGCTTHLAAIISFELARRGFEFVDYPLLIRLNPAVPWKTRGNGAVAIRVRADESREEELAGLVFEIAESYIGRTRGVKRQPSLVIYKGDIPEDIEAFGRRALGELLPKSLAREIIERHRDRILVYPNASNRGIVGALAAIGNLLRGADYTYELILYRKWENCGKPREVDLRSVMEMDEATRGSTILNVDRESGRPLLIPHGGDPVLLGIRGETPCAVIRAARMLRILEEIDYAALFRTNQHTDPHLVELSSISLVRPYMCAKLRGVVGSKPARRRGGHVFFKLCDNTACIDVAAYEPTKGFRDIVQKLEPGDVVEVLGCVRPPGSSHGLTLNLEKLHVIEVAPKVIEENPLCPVCGRRLKSAGRGKGFKCEFCGFRSRELEKIRRTAPRDISPGWYEPPPSAFKHVMKPLERFGREKREFREEIIFVVGRSLDDLPECF